MSSQSKRTGKKSKKRSNPSKRFKIGLGIATYNRPDYLKQVIQGVRNHLIKEVDSIWIYNDGSAEDYSEVYDSLPPGIKVHHEKTNKGIAKAKNWLMNQLLEEGCYSIFISEDDIVPVDKKAIRGYVQAARSTGISHMMFAHHGPANAGGAIGGTEHVSVYPSCVGAWTFYTRPALRKVGLHDENFHNAYEHVELTWRLAKAGYTTPFRYYADATGSDKWIKEIPGSFNNSSIGKTPEWGSNVIKALEYWENKDEDFPLKDLLNNLRKSLDKK
jgi:GT2 family glycosyltransferase